MPAFTYQWTNRCRLKMLHSEGEPLRLSAGSAFRQRGVRVGDSVYVIAYNLGRTFLIGRMRVAALSTREQWDAANDNADLWEGEEVIDGTDGTPMRFERTLPVDVLRRVLFVDSKGDVKGLEMDEDGVFDPQALRSVRQITEGTARLLDSILGSTP